VSSFIARIDRRAEVAYLARFTPDEVDKIVAQAAGYGGRAAAKVLAPQAPIGTAKRLSQYYRRMGLGHGTFRRSVRAAKIRGRGSALRGQLGKTVGYVIGPIGKNAYTRAWIELGTRPHGGHPGEGPNPWVEQAASDALSVARDASDAVLALYGEAR